MGYRWSRLGLFAISTTLLAGCSGESRETPQVGELSMRLRSDVNGVGYRLRDGIFSISGPQTLTLSTEEEPDAPAISRSLQAGDYTIELQSGWRLEKELPSGFQTVNAELLTANPLSFAIASEHSTSVTYGFRTDGVTVGMGDGDLTLGIQVEDTSVSAGGVEIVGNLDGRLLQTPCADSPPTDDCRIQGVVDETIVECQNGQLNIVLDHPIAGTPGQSYAATLHFYGIVDPRNYGNAGQRESGALRPQNLNTGATPPPWFIGVPGQAFAATDYSSYELHVFNELDQEVGVYYVNSDTMEGHYTYVLNYERTIPIVGGGRVQVRLLDRNCRQIKNCGATGGAPCAPKARTVDISQVDPLPTTLFQPGLGKPAEHSGQWLLIDVTDVQPL